jgi:hypothetical protein
MMLPTINHTRLIKNRNQQIFVTVTSDIDTNSIISTLVGEYPLAQFAWIKFGPAVTSVLIEKDDDNNITKIYNFQGNRLMDMPPPAILKAFAHGVPVDMSDHVKKLFPEWTRPNTLAAWLDSVMAKWRADISKMATGLQQTLCKDGAPDDEKWHMRDVPTIQLDLYNDVLAYIATQRGVSVETLRLKEGQKGGLPHKISAKSKKMTRYTQRAKKQKQRGGAATSMPLAYFQDGAQMRGTYGEPTGVGLAGSTNSMARVGISQTGGAATSMPLAYFQDGAQMRGTYAEPTGVGLAGSTNTMARVGISQNGGACNCAPGATQQGGHVPCDGRDAQQSGRHQQGGFIPSIMGPVVTNGAYLMPVASYMGYKMLNGKRKGRTAGRTSRKGSHPSGSRTGRAHRGPRSTHKKRR